jgi:carbon-monoxide dehydrogenase large subunit
MSATIEAPETFVGKPLRRREDPKLMTGEGNFLDDVRLPGMAYATVLRSPVAHAKIRGIDTRRAQIMPGVLGVFTGEDLADVIRQHPASPCTRRSPPGGRPRRGGRC